MVCPICHKNAATEKVERRLGSLYVTGEVCTECEYKAYGLSDRTFFELFYVVPNKKCRTCGRTFGEISETLLVGCEDCYNSFEQELKPLIAGLQRINDD